MMAFVWVVWREGNDRIFNNSCKSYSVLHNSIFFPLIFGQVICICPLREKYSLSSMWLLVGLACFLPLWEELQPSLLALSVGLDVGGSRIADASISLSVIRTYYKRRRRGSGDSSFPPQMGSVADESRVDGRSVVDGLHLVQSSWWLVSISCSFGVLDCGPLWGSILCDVALWPLGFCLFRCFWCRVVRLFSCVWVVAILLSPLVLRLLLFCCTLFFV